MIDTQKDPEFRRMTPDQIKEGLAELNKVIRQLKSLPAENIQFIIHDYEELRAKYKQVWRARPGRKFHDVAARRDREKQRRNAKIKKIFGLGP